MVAWTKKQYKVDCNKVFVTGSSSGAMMKVRSPTAQGQIDYDTNNRQNVMAATYPELFAAGIAYAGVAASCFVSATDQVQAWNSTCSQGKSVNTPEVWAGVAKAMYPGYNGPRPKMQIHHGSADTALLPPNYETCKQWAGVFGYKYDAPKSVVENTPRLSMRPPLGVTSCRVFMPPVWATRCPFTGSRL
jgi:acetylxylan esterase